MTETLAPKVRSPERDALVWCTAIGVADDAAPRIRELFAAHGRELDWGVFLDEAVRQRVGPLVWANLEASGLAVELAESVPRNHEHFLRMVYGGNRLRNACLIEALSQILRAADRRGLELLVRKGAYLSTVVYQDLGARIMADIDLLVRRADAAKGVALLTELGYHSGRLARDMSHIESFTRHETAVINLTIPNIPSMARLELNPVVKAIEVDLTTGLFERGTGYEFPVADVFARAESIQLHDAPARVASPEDFMIDLCAHLYRHAKSVTCIGRGTDLNLSRFCDVARYARRLSTLDRWSGVVELVQRSGLRDPIYFALHWTDHVYPGCVPAWVRDALAPEDDAYLYRYGEHEQKPGEWGTRDLFVRLFDHSRQWI
jgi:Uncharacterised nucleotidyltransferase